MGKIGCVRMTFYPVPAITLTLPFLAIVVIGLFFTVFANNIGQQIGKVPGTCRKVNTTNIEHSSDSRTVGIRLAQKTNGKILQVDT